MGRLSVALLMMIDVFFVALWTVWFCRNLFVYGDSFLAPDGSCAPHHSFDWAADYLRLFQDFVVPLPIVAVPAIVLQPSWSPRLLILLN